VKNQTCGNCKYHGDGAAVIADGMAACRRYPPQMIVLPAQTFQGMQMTPAAATPATAPTHWCGEWVGREAVIAMNQ